VNGEGGREGKGREGKGREGKGGEEKGRMETSVELQQASDDAGQVRIARIIPRVLKNRARSTLKWQSQSRPGQSNGQYQGAFSKVEVEHEAEVPIEC
jgi:hypothetical protein